MDHHNFISPAFSRPSAKSQIRYPAKPDVLLRAFARDAGTIKGQEGQIVSKGHILFYRKWQFVPFIRICFSENSESLDRRKGHF